MSKHGWEFLSTDHFLPQFYYLDNRSSIHFGLPNDYIYAEINNKFLFYKIYDKMNFIEAKEQCEQDGTTLVIPKSGKK